jgi:diguanylate cyclase (GGDEF)-like protein
VAVEPTRHLPAGRSTRPHEFGWLRAVDQLGTGPERIRALAVGGQLVAAGVLALFALAALPRLLTLDSLAALEDLLLAAGLAVSARSTALAARRTVWWDSYPVAQLSAVVVLALAGLVGAGGPAVSGLAYVLLVVSSAPYLRGLRAAVVVAGCSAGHLAALVVHEPGPGLAQRWLALTGVLLVVTLLAPAHAADRTVLHDLVHLEVVDRVTGLVTTPYLDQAGRHAAARTARSGPISVVAARIEGLDELTREHGHDVVDMALERLAARLQGSLRPGDVLARTAPDELVALLPNADADAAEEVAGALRACAGSDVDPAIVLVTGVASAQPRHPAGRVADLVARARAQRPSRQPGRQPGRQPAGG